MNLVCVKLSFEKLVFNSVFSFMHLEIATKNFKYT